MEKFTVEKYEGGEWEVIAYCGNREHAKKVARGLFKVDSGMEVYRVMKNDVEFVTVYEE